MKKVRPRSYVYDNLSAKQCSDIMNGLNLNVGCEILFARHHSLGYLENFNALILNRTVNNMSISG